MWRMYPLSVERDGDPVKANRLPATFFITLRLFILLFADVMTELLNAGVFEICNRFLHTQRCLKG